MIGVVFVALIALFLRPIALAYAASALVALLAMGLVGLFFVSIIAGALGIPPSVAAVAVIVAFLVALWREATRRRGGGFVGFWS